MGKSPDELVNERKQELKSEDQRERHKTEMKVKAFLDVLAGEGKSPNTRKSYFEAIRIHFSHNWNRQLKLIHHNHTTKLILISSSLGSRAMKVTNEMSTRMPREEGVS
jgi:hypothetical protein